MITMRSAEVAAGHAVKGTIAPNATVDVAWLVWRLEPVVGMGAKAITDYTVVEKRDLAPGVAFEFNIPRAGPLSYEGKRIRIVWEIVVGSDSSGNKVEAFASFKVVAGP